jgi:hypothetical protein
MKIVEQRHEGEPWLMWKLGNLLTVDQDIVKSIGIAWGFKEDGKWNWIPRRTPNGSLFMNAVFFFRLNWPLGIFWSIRWSESSEKKALLQSGIGFKLNGRFAILLRAQSDETSARGVTGPNYGQARGFEYGTH